MKKSLNQKAFILFTLLFVLIAVASFAAFQGASEVCTETRQCLQSVPAGKSGDIIWEVFSRQFLSLTRI